jgi:2-succinyl-5-enolpyruvyl-6-hydroxy-3-cyclohexene-1-carboxylate synthase
VRVLVLNDAGGRIFSRLPQRQAMDDEEFDALMRTPGGLDVRSAAGMFGTAYRLVEDPSQLPDALSGGTAVIEIPIAT